ncbi:ABC transporter ATP-binding protein [Stackebrandtia nassauensis]|uniref:ABC transporter related protein n=1 Tax=Stackebrandtia nassauensis (strain DSM 44728 / CIP 108903 / NRRL B-16338 / NBRC 102104 / LLR-40K-21) TaxID=446470 RepID=D3Q0N9_STANL|nr:ABC transporter ATP-binding protein [Stackebrandtia nassauensis]ADD41775.1 ABC transporter related protein [Stackebrandtia nassauensis DSM 44728]
MSGLPVATSRETAREVGSIAAAYKGQVFWTVVLYTIASAAGLGAPWLLGELIDSLDAGNTSTVDAIAMAVAGFVLTQALFSGISHYVSSRFGETVMARLREEFVRRSLALPLSTVERAGTGDLMTRSSRDIAQLGQVLRRAAPESFVCVLTLVLTLAALTLASPLLALVALVTTVPVLWAPARWYLRRAREAYLAENATYSEIAEGLAATVEGARTVEALRIQRDRIDKGQAVIGKSYGAERRTLFLRSVLFPSLDFGVTLPVAAVLLVGGLMYAADLTTLGAVTAAVLYINQAGEPMFMLLAWLDELQTGDASLGRIIGVGPIKQATVDEKRPAPQEHGAAVRVRDVRYAYNEGHDVLHGVSLDIAPGERLAVVGPSGAGKSTLGRLIAGIDSPGMGSLTVAGHDLRDATLEELRREVLLVTQEHHVFLGTVRDNLALANTSATDEQITEALTAVDADEWLASLPHGLDTVVGSAELKVEPARAQQIALARLVLADPDVLVLDEATSLLDPRAARHLERHLATVLSGRTVVAIAHRLHTAHDADRIAVVEDGRIAELGSHDELVAAGGHYAALWRSWQGN